MEPGAPFTGEPGAPLEPTPVRSTPADAQLPTILMGAAGALAGIAIVLAFIWLRAETPVQTAGSPAKAVTTAPPPPVVEASLPAWTGRRHASWARDGSKTISFELKATRDVPAWMSRAHPVLVVRCLYRTTEAFVALDTSAGFEAEPDHRTVRVQWDDEPLAVQKWESSESGRELFAPNGVDFVRQLAHGNRLRFGFTPFNAQPVSVDFAVQGFDQVAGLVASTCGWRLDS